MGNIALQYGPLTIAVQDVGNAGTSFAWSLLGAQLAGATSTTGTASTQTAAVSAAVAAASPVVGQFNLGPLLPFTNPLSGPNTMFPAADSPGANISVVDDDFSGNYLNSKWTQISNGAGAAFGFGRGSATVYPSPLVAVNLCAITTPIPSTSFEITAKINVNGIQATAPLGGMLLSDGTKYVCIGTLTASNTVTYATFTTATGTFASVATAVVGKRPQYWRINYALAVAANVQFNWSEDGVSFVTAAQYTGLAAVSGFSTVVASFLSATMTAGTVGFGGYSGIVANGGLSASCEWIRQTG